MSRTRINDPGLFILRLLLILFVGLQLGSFFLSDASAAGSINTAAALLALGITQLAYRLSSIIPSSMTKSEFNQSSALGVVLVVVSFVISFSSNDLPDINTALENDIAIASISSALLLVGVMLIAGNIVINQLLIYFEENEQAMDNLIETS